MLDFLRGRALPGMEVVDDSHYLRVIGDADAPGWLRVGPWPRDDGEAGHALKLEVHGCPPARLLSVVERVRRMFDLDADPRAINDTLSRDPRLRALVRRRPGLRLPSGWDGFEIALRAVIGQQVSVAAARTLTKRLAERFGTPLPDAFAARGLTHSFPEPERLLDADMAGIGLPAARTTTIRTIAQAVVEGRVDFRAERTLDEIVERWTALPGIGPWTAQYIALRALGHPDAFPAEDLVLQKHALGDGGRPTRQQLLEPAQPWRPWRGYAVIQIWREAALAPRPAWTPSTPRKPPARRSAA